MAAASSLRLHFSPWLLSNPSSRILLSIPRSHPLLSNPRTVRVFALPLLHRALITERRGGESFRKKKVVMRVGYVGSDFRGLQKQPDVKTLSRT